MPDMQGREGQVRQVHVGDLMEKVLIDVRTREEFVKEHIKGAMCIPHYDLKFYVEFLKDKDIDLYCNTERRSTIAQDRLAEMGISSKVMTLKEQDRLEWEKNSMICAANFVTLRPGHEDEFMKKATMLCRATEHIEGFLGSKVLKISGVSGIGSFVPGDLTDLEIVPVRIILLTYWASKEVHERSHLDPEFKAIFDSLGEHLIEMPREEFYEVLK